MTPKERVEDYLKRFCSNDTDMAWHIVNLEDSADSLRSERDVMLQKVEGFEAERTRILHWATRPLPSRSDHNHFQSGLPDSFLAGYGWAKGQIQNMLKVKNVEK